MSTLIKDKVTNEWKTVNGVYISMPVGAVTAFMGTEAPECWLICDGSTFNENEYPSLRAVLGSNVLPDLRGRFLQGANKNPGEYVEAGLPNITGNFSLGDATGGASRRGSLRGDGTLFNNSSTTTSEDYNGNDRHTSTNAALKFDASKSNSIYGKSKTVQPPACTVNYIIKAV